MRKALALALVALAAAIAIYAAIHEKLLAQPIWTSTGLERFGLFTAVFWIIAAAFVILRPAWLVPAFTLLVAAVTVWRCGLLAPLAVLYFLGSCFLLGRIFFSRSNVWAAILAGLAAWIFGISCAVYFPINYGWFYAAAFAIPYAIERRRLIEHARGFALRVESKRDALALATLLFALLAHWLVALLPEVSADGLAMHLAIPMAVAHEHVWAFDFHQYAWALMPMGGDWAYTAVYLLGGEAAARLLNFAMLVVIAALLATEARRWLAPAAAWIAAALFASTPLVQLATGSLFVENLWAAMLFGAVTQVLRGELMLSAMLFGAALSIKVGTVAFLVPAAVAFGIAVKGRMQTAVAAALLLAGLAAPPYLNAWLRTGNPIFPFANQFFKSPDFDLAPLQDLRFHAKVGWTTPYEATFRSSKFYEGQNGGLGFQYWLLLPAVILLLRRGAPWKLFGIAAAGAILSFVSTPNLRYLYPSLPLFSLAIAWAIVELPLLAPVAIAIGLANFAFLESSGWYHKDFAAFTPAGARKYLEEGAPQRLLIDRLNRETPGEPVAFFNGAAIAGLHARAYSDTWHSYPYWTRMGGARSSDEVAAIYRELGIHRIVAPFPLDRWQSPYPSVDNFLDDWTQPTGITAGAFGLFELRTAPLPHDQRGPAPAGAYDDVAREIEYRGSWIRDRQFSPASGGTLTYANSPGDLLRFSFAGRAITYIYTRALNRGIAQVLIDGQERARIDLYSRITEWQARTVFGNLGDGPHVIEIRVLDSANPRSSDRYVDLDAFIVE